MAIDPSALLASLSAEHAVSGAELARRLQVTRAAVWKQIEHLRELGAPVEAVAGAEAAGEPEVIKKGKVEGEAETEKEKPEKKEKEKK